MIATDIVLTPEQRIVRRHRAHQRIFELEVEAEGWSQSHCVVPLAPGQTDILLVIHQHSPAWAYQNLDQRHGNFVYLVQHDCRGEARPTSRDEAIWLLTRGAI